jgi:hypothetical protein
MGTVQRAGAHAQLPARRDSLLLAALRQATLRFSGLTAGPLLRRIPAEPHGVGRAKRNPNRAGSNKHKGAEPQRTLPGRRYYP